VAGSGKDWGTGCAFVDYDRDGLLDIVVANYVDFDLANTPAPGQGVSCIWKGVPVMCGPRGLKNAPNLLYHNLGRGKFEDVSKKAGLEKTSGHYAFSVSTLDFDNDGWPDIFIACDSTPSILYRNNHDGTFSDVAVVAGAAFNEDGREQAGMGSTVGDFDGDGKLDIFKTNFSDDSSTLYRNNGDGTFTDATYSSGLGLHTQYLGWGTMFLDFDNDGWPDLLLVNGHVYPEVDKYKLGSDYQEPRILYRNSGKGTFEDVSTAAGRGLAIGDLWNDGRISALITNMGEAPSLLVNQMSYPNHWIGIKTVGTKSNRDGIGARIVAKAGGRTFANEVRSGSSYNSSSDMRLHFGIGRATRIDSLEVRWPSGLVENFDARIDAINTVTEGTGKAAVAKSAVAK
jgi:enediyne biosynthesis protein E4